MYIAALLLSFLLNIINHGNVLVGILNFLLLLFLVYFYFQFSLQKPPFVKFLYQSNPLVILVGTIPMFTRLNDILILFLTLGICLLILFYIKTKYRKITLVMTVVYLVFASFYANGLIKPPFSFQNNLLIINDNWTIAYLTLMKIESQYMPSLIRTVLFNPSIHLYVMLSKMAGIYTLKNLYDAILIANIYPLIKGLLLDLKEWNKLKTHLFICVLIISFSVVVSRSTLINNTFTLLSPFLVYLILRGLNTVNKKIYLALFFVSIFLQVNF